MDTTTLIKMKILEDLYSSDNTRLVASYSKYYESLDNTQPKIVVSNALNKLIAESESKLKCVFDEDGFILSEAD